jgi:hypothetical protein
MSDTHAAIATMAAKSHTSHSTLFSLLHAIDRAAECSRGLAFLCCWLSTCLGVVRSMSAMLCVLCTSFPVAGAYSSCMQIACGLVHAAVGVGSAGGKLGIPRCCCGSPGCQLDGLQLHDTSEPAGLQSYSLRAPPTHAQPNRATHAEPTAAVAVLPFRASSGGGTTDPASTTCPAGFPRDATFCATLIQPIILLRAEM